MAIGRSLSRLEFDKFIESDDVSGQPGIVVLNPDGTMVGSSITLTTGDIEIGAVELKNAGTDDRADVGDANVARTTGTHVLAVQHVDAEGHVLDASDLDDIRTAVEKMDDWDAVGGSAAATDGPQVMGRYDSTKPTAVDDGDAVQLATDAYGRPLAGMEPERFQSTITSADAQAATSVKAKTADKKMYILFLAVSVGATALEVQFQDDAGSPAVLIEEFFLAANGGYAFKFPPEAPLVVTTNQDLDVICSAAGDVSVVVTGYLAP